MTITLNQNGHQLNLTSKIRVGKSQSFIIIKIQFPIQLVAPRTIYRFQGLSQNELIFDPTNIKKWVNIYNIIHIQTKEKLFWSTPLRHEIFYVDLRVHVKMNRLKTIATWILLMP
jgi:hypothetical protein